MQPHDIFAVPILDKYLIYSPLQKITALVNRSGVLSLRDRFFQSTSQHKNLVELVSLFDTTPQLSLETRQGRLKDPLFLGLISTRGCNMQCVYCDFDAQHNMGPVMSLDLARQAIDAYFELLIRENCQRADIQFFGGEPFFAPDVVLFAEAYGRRWAEQAGLPIHFEVTTNGLFNARLATWVADHFDTVVLSLDGPEDIMESLRPARHKKPVFPTVYRNAKIFSKGTVGLILRVCVNQDTVTRLPEIAEWMVDHFVPEAVCFEVLHPTPQSDAAGLETPDPFIFAQQFNRAAKLLEARGITVIHSTACVDTSHLSFCPVGKDALIVTPEGKVNACYLPEAAWQDKGLPFQFGWVKDGHFELDSATVDAIRQHSVLNKPGCQDCICQFHCAGGCHVRQNGQIGSNILTDHCLQTRLITISNLLRGLGQAEDAGQWLAEAVDDPSLRHEKSDRLRGFNG